jgi:hypothetical protein
MLEPDAAPLIHAADTDSTLVNDPVAIAPLERTGDTTDDDTTNGDETEDEDEDEGEDESTSAAV